MIGHVGEGCQNAQKQSISEKLLGAIFTNL